MRREGGEEGREVLCLVCLEPNTHKRGGGGGGDGGCFTGESGGGRAGLLGGHVRAVGGFVFLCPLFCFCFLASRLLTRDQH